MKKTDKTSEGSILRKKAIEMLKQKPDTSGSQHFEADGLKLIHELEVHQMELELQNQELVLAKEQAELAAEKYAELYDFVQKRAAELVIANQELAFQFKEKEKSTNELIMAKEKAEESDRLKSAFLSNMSHEIRTPMNGIIGFTELLKEADLPNEKQQLYIDIIEKSSNRLLNIITDILDISKIESGQIVVFNSKTNLNEQLQYIYSFFKPEVEQKGLQFYFRDSLPENKSIIKTDRDKVYTILTNLVKNAIKFTHSGNIEFGCNLKYTDQKKTSEQLETGVETGEPFEVEFYVKDTGIGIPPEQLEFVFERFRQGSDFLNRNYEGTGLGLSISKAFVEVLGGQIRVKSMPGKGSVFYFTLPYKTEPEEKAVGNNAGTFEGEEDDNPKKLKILVAEDDEFSEMLIILAVEKYCNELLRVRTGIEAVEACRNNPDIDLVLMDIRMPGMDGYEATRQIRKFNKQVVIIAQTAFAITKERERAIESGCDDYISKPIRKAKLMEVMQKYLNN